MYPYQRTPMGNPYIYKPYKYHGYTVRGTPNCPLSLHKRKTCCIPRGFNGFQWHQDTSAEAFGSDMVEVRSWRSGGFPSLVLEVKMVHLNFFDEKKMLGVGQLFFQKSMGSPHWILVAGMLRRKRLIHFGVKMNSYS